MNFTKEQQKAIDLKFKQRGLEITQKGKEIKVDSLLYNNNEIYRNTVNE